MADPSSFYRLNEEIAAEIARLEGEGHLDRLLGLVADADVELLVSSIRPREGLEEPLGFLRPRREGAASTPAVRTLAPADGDRLGCAVPSEDATAAVRAELTRPAGGWDHEGVLTARSRLSEGSLLRSCSLWSWMNSS